MMCEQLNEEPDPAKIPAGFEDFPYEVQEAMNIFSILPGLWEGMSGTYMGVDYTILPYLMDEVFQVDNKQQTMQLLLLIGRIIMENHTEAQKERMRKAKTKAGKKGI